MLSFFYFSPQGVGETKLAATDAEAALINYHSGNQKPQVTRSRDDAPDDAPSHVARSPVGVCILGSNLAHVGDVGHVATVGGGIPACAYLDESIRACFISGGT